MLFLADKLFLGCKGSPGIFLLLKAGLANTTVTFLDLWDGVLQKSKPVKIGVAA